MNRYNLFHKIHKGLRALLYDTGMLLQRTDFTIENEAQCAVFRIQFVVSLFNEFQQSEDAVVLPAMMGHESGIAEAFEEEHEEGYLLGQKLVCLVSDFKTVSLPLEKVSVSNELVDLFEEYTLFQILHMAQEERVVNKLLWHYYTDAELQSLAWKIINAPASLLTMPYNKWMFLGLNNNEIIGWLKEAKYTAGENEFQALLKIAAAELHPQRWSLLQAVLSTVVLLPNEGFVSSAMV